MNDGRHVLNGSELLTDLEARAAAVALKNIGGPNPGTIEQKKANSIARELVDEIRLAWAGQRLYIPFDKVRRNTQVFEEFTGANHAELARKFHISEVMIYTILREEQNKRRIKQVSLFGD